MLNQITRRKELPASRADAPRRIRGAGHADEAALERLSALDSSAPRGDVRLAGRG
jgi:hypothetical protein